MKLLRILFTLTVIYTLCSISNTYASTLTPAINEIKLAQGQRVLSSVIFGNDEDRDVEILITVYGYNPQTEEIIENSKDLFIKADTDTFTVKAKSEREIPYEIFPVNNQEKGTYFNLVVLSPIQGDKDISISKGISQLVVLHIIDPQEEVLGITTEDFSTKIEVLNKGIPFLKPLKFKYTVVNNSNYVLNPTGRIEILNKRSNYKPEYVYINTQKEKLYPKEALEKTITIDNWHISDIFSERVAKGNISNGLDSNTKQSEVYIGSYVYELMGGLVLLVGIFILIKSLREDIKKKKN